MYKYKLKIAQILRTTNIMIGNVFCLVEFFTSGTFKN